MSDEFRRKRKLTTRRDNQYVIWLPFLYTYRTDTRRPRRDCAKEDQNDERYCFAAAAASNIRHLGGCTTPFRGCCRCDARRAEAANRDSRGRFWRRGRCAGAAG